MHIQFLRSFLRRLNGTMLAVLALASASAHAALTLSDPEPKTYALMLAGLGVLGFAASRRHPSRPQFSETTICGGEDLPKTHRREVVVVFLDLRGFTAFTDCSEPEEVMSVLSEYHRLMGPLIVAHKGTLERFAGDGLMIFFNDPIMLENPAADAVRMALEMQEKFALLRAAWKRRGYDLDLGIGIAKGFATLGAIGFEGRWDYACIGGVSNLAARLCSYAEGGQILTNQKTLAVIEEMTQAEPIGELAIKGIARPVKVFNVTGLKSQEPIRIS
jgi:adenylate cyclase